MNAAHVREFALICHRRDKRALFVHTGKTGKQAAQIAKNAKMKMVSGDRLLNLLCPKNQRTRKE
ncbi:restriction endonuclease [Bathymodiolus japonicus methanotrophic gill symbiont]|uniref:restriction endonuclease n=1 Tax=Bathymodiolus japonicus methanotrophic gill symbiont TaxID=113269 RepID=UPI001C8D1F4F